MIAFVKREDVTAADAIEYLEVVLTLCALL
jgi:hypothetical protein